MNELQKHHPDWKKPDIKEYILYESVYLKILENANQFYGDKKQADGCLGLAVEGGMDYKGMDTDFPGVPVVKTPKFPMQGAWVGGIDSWLENSDPSCYTVWPKKKKRMGAYRMMEMFWNLSIVVRSQVSSFIKIYWIVQFIHQ